MTHPSGTRTFLKEHRLFKPFLAFMATFDALAMATECLKTGIVDRTEGNIGIEAQQFNAWIKFPMLKVTGAMIQNIEPQGYQMNFSASAGQPAGRLIGPIMFGYVGVSMSIITALYVEFYEAHLPWLTQKFGADKKAWPAIFNFARNIRNFIVHHAGVVHFENKNASPVTWHHLTYAPSDEGRIAVGPNNIYVGEILILMVELSDELDSLGCPKP